jgi:two-component system sensor histidine kinase/response regulator
MLPRAVTALPKSERSSAGPVAVHSSNDPPSVWVVDDSVLEAEVIRQALAPHFDVAVFTSGAAMLERLATGAPPNALVLDWYMPDMSGADVCRFIRGRFNAAVLPIAILTAARTIDSLVEALADGANDFVRKPVSGLELNARVSGLVRLAKLHAGLAEAETKLRLEVVFRERFMGMLAHDLRQPLSTVSMGCKVLAEMELPSSAAAVVSRQRRAAERMQRMVTDLLDSTSLRAAGGMPIDKRPTDFAEVARTVLDEIRSARPDHVMTLNVDGSCQGQWDADRLAQILSNLVGNAVAHGGANCPVHVQLSGTDDAVELSVANPGEPIPEEVLATLDQPFRRARAERRSGDGLGLGLYIVHHIVHAHGGTLSAEAQAGETRVLVRLPRHGRENPIPNP